MKEKLRDLPGEGSLIEELSDEELTACVGGTGIIVKLLGLPEIEVPLIHQELIEVEGSAEVSGLASAKFDPKGSGRFSSDRNIKEHFASVDVQQVLETVATLPITSWNYKEENASVRHVGPMAQDFAAAFGVGDSDRHIYNVDANGVALAAIQALYQIVQQKDAQLDQLRVELDELKQQMLGSKEQKVLA